MGGVSMLFGGARCCVGRGVGGSMGGIPTMFAAMEAAARENRKLRSKLPNAPKY